MVDSIGGPRRVNNFLSTMNVPVISNTSLKAMERRAGTSIEVVSDHSCRAAERNEVHEEAGLSPGGYTKQYADKRMTERTKQLERSALPSTKRRRLILKQERATIQGALEVQEGDSYSSGIAMDASSIDTEEIPDAVPRGNFRNVPPPPGDDDVTVITMDLETTDLIRSGYIPDITQIAAVEVKSGASFNTYVVPKKPISLGAQQTTGIVYSGGIMTVHGSNVAPQPISLSLKSFTDWLQKFKNVVLYGT